MRKLTAKWTAETVEEWKEALTPRPPYSPDLVHYWTTFLMYADLLSGHVIVLKRKKSCGGPG